MRLAGTRLLRYARDDNLRRCEDLRTDARQGIRRNTVEPSWAGVPFFYWYQLLWIPISAGLIVYLTTQRKDLELGSCRLTGSPS
jgi:hypothetical protein